MQRTGGEWSMASNRGNGSSVASRQREPPAPNGAFSWASDGGGGANNGGGVGGSWASSSNNSAMPQYHPNQQQPQREHVSAGTAISDGEYERSLIEVLTTPAGFKPMSIPTDELNQFLAVVFNLNPDVVCPILLDVISGAGANGLESNKRIKGLKVIESVLLEVSVF